ncbi:MAG: tail-specific protease [Planctomycetes bacterium]|nr:tail-specific protease [Planctomycetota bacterium]
MNSGNTRTGLRRTLILGSLVSCTIGAALLAPYVWALPSEQTKDDERIAFLVASMMNHQHLSKLELGDEVSGRAFDMFFKRLDSMKLFFLQSDIDQFAGERLLIDDKAKRGDVSLAKRVFDVFMQRVEERVAVAQRLLEEEHDFTIDEEMVRDPDKAAYAKTIAESDERWRKKVKLDLLLEIADKVEHDEAVEKLHKRYRNILRRTEQTDNDELLEMFLSALTMSFDPHSSYMSPSTLANFTIAMSLELNGIGASLQSEYGETTVKQLVPGGAADKDGRLQIGDIIVGVAEGVADSEFVDIVDMKINNVVKLIRGKPGTVVRLEVTPADKSGRKVYPITRARIELKDREARSEIVERHADGSLVGTENAAEGEATGQVVEQTDAAGGVVRKIGVISLPSFYMDMKGRRENNPNYKSTTRDVRRLLEEFNRQNVDLVIMDLRYNGGGSLPESVDVTGLFIDQGPVVQVKGIKGLVTPYRDENPGAVWKKPLIVVINKFSASASEIFAGAIQDYGRGIVVGDKTTHGKGTVQQLAELGQKLLPFRKAPNLGALKLTIQQFYRPSGDSTQNRGVISDVELPHRTTHWDVGESDLDYAMAFDRIMPMPHSNYRNATADIIGELQKRSSSRCDESEFFATERRKIERYLEQKKNPMITLNKEKFLAERAKVNDQKEIYDKLQEEDKPVFPTTPYDDPTAPYNDELVSIALDYLELLGLNKVAVAK